MSYLPAYFPRTVSDLADWRRSKTVRSVNDEMDQLNNELLIADEMYARLVAGSTDKESVYGTLALDDAFAVQLAYNYAQHEDNKGRFLLLAAMQTHEFRELLRVLKVAKRRAGMSRADMKARAERAGGAA